MKIHINILMPVWRIVEIQSALEVLDGQTNQHHPQVSVQKKSSDIWINIRFLYHAKIKFVIRLYCLKLHSGHIYIVLSDTHYVFIACFSEYFNTSADSLHTCQSCCYRLHCSNYTFDKSADCRDWSCYFRLTPETICVPFCVKEVLCNTVKLLPQARKISSRI